MVLLRKNNLGKIRCKGTKKKKKFLVMHSSFEKEIKTVIDISDIVKIKNKSDQKSQTNTNNKQTKKDPK